MTDKPSRQYLWQLKKRAEGCCTICGKERGQYGTKIHCSRCAQKTNMRKTQKRHSKLQPKATEA